jgi:FAD/FMN-containing dehydrogenase
MQMQRPEGFRGAWRTDDLARAAYSEAAGIHRLLPQVVAVPEDADDVVALTRWAAAQGVPLTPRGAGSSMAGGAVGTGVIVDCSRMTALGPVRTHTWSYDAAADDEADAEPGSRVVAEDPDFAFEQQAVEVGPGVLCDALVAHADEAGALWAVRPSSHAFCTIGGMVATHAAGARYPHGVDQPLRGAVLGVECVFSDGSRGWVHRDKPLPDCEPVRRALAVGPGPERQRRGLVSHNLLKCSSGYHAEGHTDTEWLLHALIGSEGTLATFTAIDLALDDPAPETGLLLVAFDALEAAAEGAVVCVETGCVTAEVFDRTFLEVAKAHEAFGVPPETEAVLLIEARWEPQGENDPGPEELAAGFEEMAGVVRVELADDAERAAALWELRKAVSPILAALPGHVRSMQVIEDGAVPPDKLGAYLQGVRDRCARYGLPVVQFGHALHGNIHANVLVDVTQPGWQGRLDELLLDVTALVRTLGGVMSGEHGDGRLRAGVLERVWNGKSLAWFRALKEAMDPQGLLNPGVKFAAPGAPLLGAPIKYDPALPAHPGPVGALLERVQREKLWGRHRLDLLGEMGG